MRSSAFCLALMCFVMEGGTQEEREISTPRSSVNLCYMSDVRHLCCFSINELNLCDIAGSASTSSAALKIISVSAAS